MSEFEPLRQKLPAAPAAHFDAAPPRATVQRAESGEGASCRLGDASCASAHAASVSRAAMGSGETLQRSVLQLQQDYGNHFVGHVLRQAAGDSTEGGGMDAIERTIASARGGGHGLDHATRHQMENSFGADFGNVRVHHDARADGLGHALSARAFATGHDVFFRQGEYSPGTSAGRELLAHELTHVVQQNGTGIRRKMTVSQPGDPHEVEADQMARAVMQQEHAQEHAEHEHPQQDHKEQEHAQRAPATQTQRQPEAPKATEEDEKKKLHAKADTTLVARQDDDEAAS